MGELSDGWKLYGKTSSGFCDDENRSVGWFVGWMSRGEKNIVFALLMYGDATDHPVSGSVAKRKVIEQLVGLAVLGCDGNCVNMLI